MGKRKATQSSSPSSSGNIDKFLIRVEGLLDREIMQMEKKITEGGGGIRGGGGGALPLLNLY